MAMLRFLGRRLAWSLFALWVSITIVFLLVNAVGDPAVATLGPRAGHEQLEDFRHKYHLDRPLPARYVAYLADVARGDFGRSFRDEQPVSDVLWTRLPRTVLLGAMGLVIQFVVGLLIGIIAAVYRNRPLDTATMSAAFVGISAPTFLTGLLFLDWLAFRLGWFPVGGYGVDFVDHVWHAVLPSIGLAVIGAATYARVMRGEMIETLRTEYVRTARAKGASASRVVFLHAARNALLPIVVLAGLDLPLLVSGALITESIYGWPGLGRLAIEAISALDIPIVMGVVVLGSVGVQAGNFLADVAVAWLDPRVRVE